MRVAYFSSLIVIGFAFFACQGTLGPSEDEYNYRAYDQSGKLVVTGTLKFEQLDIKGVKGSWQLRNVNGSDMTGISEAFGVFEGSLKGDALYLDLHPGWRDNNVILQGLLSGDSYRGEWAYIGYPGVLNEGNFEASLD